MLPAELEGRPRVSDISSEWSRKVSVPSSAALLGVCGCAVPAPALALAAGSSRPLGNDDGHVGSPKVLAEPTTASAAGCEPDVPAAPVNEILWVN